MDDIQLKSSDQASEEPQTVNAFNRYGDPEQIPQDSINQYLQAGYRLATPQEIHNVKIQQQYGSGIGNYSKATAAAALRGPTFGGSDVVLTHLGITTPETLSGLKEANPWLSGASEFGGTLAGLALAPESEVAHAARTAYKAALATGDAAKIGAAKVAWSAAKEIAPELTAGSILNPVGALSTISKQVAEKASPAAAAFVGDILAKPAAQFAGSAIEGAAFGLGNSVSESALGDPDAMGEKLLTNVGWGAVLGGGLGGLIKAGEIPVPKSLEAAQDALVGVKNAGEGISEVGTLASIAAKVSSFISGKPEEDILSAWKNRALLAKSPEEASQISKEFHGSLSNLQDTVSTLLKDANKTLRPEETEALLGGVDPVTAQDTWLKHISDIEAVTKEMRSEPHLYSEYYPRTLEKITEGFEKEITSDSSAGDVFNALNKLKGRLDEEIKYGRELDPKIENSQGAIRGLRTSIKNALEDENTWGEAGARQAAFNDAQSEFLKLTGKGGPFQKTFMGKALTKGGNVTYKIDPGKIQTYLSRLNSIAGEEKSKVLQSYLGSAQKVIGEVGNTYESLPARSFDSDAVQNVVNKAQESVSRATAQTEQQKLMNSLGAGGHNVQLAEGLAAGVAMHNPILAGGIEAFSMGKNPALMIQRLSKIESAAKTITKGIQKGASSIFNAGVSFGNKTAGYVGAKIAEDEYQKRIKEVQSFGNDPNKLFDAMSDGTKHLYKVAPQITQSVNNTAARSVQFLNSKVPQQPNPKPFSKPLPPNKADMESFNRYYDTVQDPNSVFASIKAGTLTPEHVETVQTVTPKIYQEQTQHLISQMMEAKAKNKTISYPTKMALSLFLGQDLDDSLEQPLIAQNQMAMQVDQANEQAANAVKTTQSGLSKLTKSTSLMTPMQQTAHREA